VLLCQTALVPPRGGAATAQALEVPGAFLPFFSRARRGVRTRPRDLVLTASPSATSELCFVVVVVVGGGGGVGGGVVVVFAIGQAAVDASSSSSSSSSAAAAAAEEGTIAAEEEIAESRNQSNEQKPESQVQ
jgi:hypothetical protein